ncbi:MAG: hydantoinase B/oxoprolinase family protein [Alphaproteobacteria bacterium]|jgi:N-methylhydantoinase B|nr:hydantoinase B/oxoprolinase family protein [Alphaproteobacteria bacterium]MBT4082234.1 hydantoinase B/oxoprolinase family protein [Alphaproteobacteria bacterium]MBT4544975.1 hydantoinase B/oxoprolinase family protein [Alphaproteobacteria bacterium]MBT5918638.1 hydantoinase B/oxoprolinase family protein [Alphaproteobacteria bacterium]MBT7745758.1 hydantoinase B/oxoprolinase family protein [Alphaproteobacteria bacterium]
MSKEALEKIHQQVMWNRLIAVVEEQAQAILRTAFGSIVREAGDLSAGVYNLEGQMLAQAVTGTPGHVNTMARAVDHFLVRFPVDSMKPGDVYVTNDPWLGTGHLFDFVVVSPAWHQGKIVALFASTCHVIDIGGRGFTADAASVFEEGVNIPHMKLRSEGTLNDDLIRLIESNSRNPVEVKGDILSLVSCNDTGAARLTEMMAEFDLDSIAPLGKFIMDNSRDAMIKAIKAVPNGAYDTEMELDGYESPVFLRAEMTVSDDEIVVDYAGTSPASSYGINSPLCYTEAYTCFGLKCIVAPAVPNNHGSLEVFRVAAEEGSAVHPLHPSPVTARHVIGQMLPDVAFGCLSKALKGQVPAESAGSIWVLPMANVGGASGNNAANTSRFNVMNVGMGGIGARPGKDGLSVTAFPSGIGAVPVEVTEADSPLVFWRKEFAPDSGGPGAFRGGLGQIIEIGNSEEAPFTISGATFDRMRNAPRGRDDGQSGALGRAYLASGQEFHDKSVHTVPEGERFVVELPGGGGLGDPHQRELSSIEQDIEGGYVTPEGAARDYGYKK